MTDGGTVSALTRELERGEVSEETEARAPAWARRFVQAAQRRSVELENALGIVQEDVINLRAKTAMVIKENEELHARLEREARDQQMAANGGSAEENAYTMPIPGERQQVNDATSAEYAREMNERVDLLSSENALLVEEAATLQAELERLRIEAERGVHLRTDMQSALERTKNESATLEKKFVEESGARKALEAQFIAKCKECGKLSAEVNKLDDALSASTRTSNSLRTTIKEKNQANLELAARLESESENSWAQVRDACARSRELADAASRSARELDNERENARRERRELELCQQDNAGMLKVMNGMEKQLAAYAAREAGIAESAREARDTCQNALLERDALRSKLELVLRELNDERNTKVRDLKESRAQHMKSLSEVRADAASRIKVSQDALDTALRAAALDSAARSEAERAKNKAETIAHRLESRLTEFDVIFRREALLPLQDKLTAAYKRIASLEDDLSKTRAFQTSSITLISETKGSTPLSELEEEVRAARADAEAAETRRRDLTSELSAKEKQLKRLEQNLDTERSEYAHKVNQLKQDSDLEKRKLNEAILALRKANDEAQTAFLEQQQRHNVALTKLIQDRDSSLEAIRTRLSDEQHVVAKLSAYDQDLELRLANVLAELANEKNSTTKLQDAASVAQRRASDLANQLSRSLAEQDKLLSAQATHRFLVSSSSSTNAAIAPSALTNSATTITSDRRAFDNTTLATSSYNLATYSGNSNGLTRPDFFSAATTTPVSARFDDTTLLTDDSTKYNVHEKQDESTAKPPLPAD